MGMHRRLVAGLALVSTAGGLALLPTVTAAQTSPVRFIKAVEVRALVERGLAPVLVDVRSREEYLARHIAGAISIPLNEIVQRAHQLPRERLVVLY